MEHSQNEEPKYIDHSKNWTVLSFSTQEDAFNFLKESNYNDENIVKLKLLIDDNFDEISMTNMKQLQYKFRNKSVVIFISIEDDERFLIYWKLKNTKQFLSLKPYKKSFFGNDKHLCEYVADFLVNSLENGSLGKIGVKSIITDCLKLLFLIF